MTDKIAQFTGYSFVQDGTQHDPAARVISHDEQPESKPAVVETCCYLDLPVSDIPYDLSQVPKEAICEAKAEFGLREVSDRRGLEPTYSCAKHALNLIGPNEDLVIWRL